MRRRLGSALLEGSILLPFILLLLLLLLSFYRTAVQLRSVESAIRQCLSEETGEGKLLRPAREGLARLSLKERLLPVLPEGRQELEKKMRAKVQSMVKGILPGAFTFTVTECRLDGGWFRLRYEIRASSPPFAALFPLRSYEPQKRVEEAYILRPSEELRMRKAVKGGR